MGGIKKLFNIDIGDHGLPHAKSDGRIAPPFAGHAISAMAGTVKSRPGKGVDTLPECVAHIGN